MDRVAVMMSTFNGERFIEEQVDSILSQIGVSVDLYIRDDGSTDDTLQILKKYAFFDNVKIRRGKHAGVGRSFMGILYSIPDDYDYYAFSDQDDIWEKDKLITAIRQIRGESGCVLYASNLECVDEDNHHIGMRFEPDWKATTSLLSIIQSSKCYGCTMVFNRQLFLLLRCRKPAEQVLDTRFHDVWVAVSAAAAGHIIFDMDSHIKYRRHEKNCTRINTTKAELWKDRFYKILHEEKRKPRSKTAKEIVRCYPEYVEKDPDCYTIHLLADQKNFLNRLELIKNRDRIISLSKEPDVCFIIKVLFGLV